MKLLKSLPVQLVLSIALAFTLSSYLNAFTISLFYSISSAVIEALLFVLPIIIFTYLFQALANSSRGNLKLVLLIFAGVTLSCCLALTTAYLFGKSVLPGLNLDQSPDFVSKLQTKVSKLFSLGLPTIMGTEKAMLLGMSLGILVSFLNDKSRLKTKCRELGCKLSTIVTFTLQRLFIPLVPLYVFGFCVKLAHEGALLVLFEDFGKVFLASIGLVITYLFLLYFLGAQGDIRKAFQNIRTMVPAGLTGFSTMSSAATMPVTLKCAEKTTGDSDYAKLIIPSTANIHMLGDDMTIMVASMALLTVYGMPWPDLLTFIPFMIAFALAKLSCVGVPGATVLVILPVLQNYLGFSAEMISAITTIYILQDPFGTTGNVMGNGAFALIIQRFIAKKPVLNN